MACNSLSGTKYNLAQIQGILRQAGWPESQIAKAAAIVIYESGGYNRAYNGCGEDSYGWFQIYRRYHPEFEPSYDNGQIFDPLYNAKAGLSVYRARRDDGWNAWINSNRKYNQDLNGIASQSRAIYAQGAAGNGVITTASSLPVATDNNGADNTTSKVLFLTAGVGLLALLLIRPRYEY